MHFYPPSLARRSGTGRCPAARVATPSAAARAVRRACWAPRRTRRTCAGSETRCWRWATARMGLLLEKKQRQKGANASVLLFVSYVFPVQTPARSAERSEPRACSSCRARWCGRTCRRSTSRDETRAVSSAPCPARRRCRRRRRARGQLPSENAKGAKRALRPSAAAPCETRSSPTSGKRKLTRTHPKKSKKTHLRSSEECVFFFQCNGLSCYLKLIVFLEDSPTRISDWWPLFACATYFVPLCVDPRNAIADAVLFGAAPPPGSDPAFSRAAARTWALDLPRHASHATDFGAHDHNAVRARGGVWAHVQTRARRTRQRASLTPSRADHPPPPPQAGPDCTHYCNPSAATRAWAAALADALATALDRGRPPSGGGNANGGLRGHSRRARPGK
jgi:hypothetical protein